MLAIIVYGGTSLKQRCVNWPDPRGFILYYSRIHINRGEWLSLIYQSIFNQLQVDDNL